VNLPSYVETVVVGAGQAGLSMSWYLARAGRPHLVLEARSTMGGGWQDRWDEFLIVTPNWSTALPGFPYGGSDPDGFMPKAEIAARIAAYASVIDAPVALETRVTKLTQRGADGFRLDTNQGPIDTDTVVVAAGSFHKPKLPPISAALPHRLTQLHSHYYRKEADLPPGAVLVVGSGQSGAQLAEELFEAGRQVYLSVGSAGRIPRRYRGRDTFFWLVELAKRDQLPTVDQLPSPGARFVGNPAWSGHHGGRDTNLRDFARRGMTLLGRIEDVDGSKLALAPDLPINLARADAFFGERFKPLIDGYVEAGGLAAPVEEPVQVSFDPPVLETLDLDRTGIGTVLWTTGYSLDYAWIDLPIFDEFGYPRQKRGVTEVPGIYFTGLIWQHNNLSTTLPGAGIEARHVAGQMGLLEAGEPVSEASRLATEPALD
jgi:putative flavoprotein involved in K+ transport